jgi:molecular chaperone GrpE
MEADLTDDATQMDAPEAANDGAAAAPHDEIARLLSENAALKDQAMRYAAEAENTRRRAEREANDARAFAIQRFARDLLDAADNLARALQASPKDAADPATKNLVTGIEMTEKALLSAFERNGLKRVDPKRGDRFDPNLHQAMLEQPADDVPPGSVVNVMQTGYELFGRIVRPALVAVTPKAAGAGAGAAAAHEGGSGAYAQTGGPGAGGAFDTRA